MPQRELSESEAPMVVVSCEECGGKPGYDPQTGIELKQGHFSSCSKWRQ